MRGGVGQAEGGGDGEHGVFGEDAAGASADAAVVHAVAPIIVRIEVRAGKTHGGAHRWRSRRFAKKPRAGCVRLGGTGADFAGTQP